MTEQAEDWGGSEGNLATAPVVDTPKPKGKRTAQAAAPEVAEVRTKIVLEDNDQIGPNGQFFGAQGKGYLLRPGEPVEVPESILNILDTAVTSVPIQDSSQTVIGYRDRLRFPYRVLTARRTA